MTLREPFHISSRLLPALRVPGGSISLEPIGIDSDGRIRWRTYFDIGDLEIVEEELRTITTYQGAFETLMSFVSAFGEAISYQESTGRRAENADLFDARLAEWASTFTEELSLLGCMLQEEAFIEE